MPAVLGATTAPLSPAATCPPHGLAIRFFTARMMAAIALAEPGTLTAAHLPDPPKKYSIAILITLKCSAPCPRPLRPNPFVCTISWPVMPLSKQDSRHLQSTLRDSLPMSSSQRQLARRLVLLFSWLASHISFGAVTSSVLAQQRTWINRCRPRCCDLL